MRRLVLPLLLPLVLGSCSHSLGVAGTVSVSDLPLIEIPARGTVADTLVVFLSGDGGWAELDQKVGRALAVDGHGVVGLSSLRYFWKPRTPESAASDLERILRHYLTVWAKRRVVLVGYSFGADVLPFLVNRLPADLRARIELIALLGMSATTAFEFHLSEWFGGASGPELPVVPELRKLQGLRILCLFGDEESASPCRQLEPSLAKVVALPGAHHFGGDYRSVAALITKELEDRP